MLLGVVSFLFFFFFMIFFFFVFHFFFFQAEDGIRGHCVTGVQTCALPDLPHTPRTPHGAALGRRGQKPFGVYYVYVVFVRLAGWLNYTLLPRELLDLIRDQDLLHRHCQPLDPESFLVPLSPFLVVSEDLRRDRTKGALALVKGLMVRRGAPLTGLKHLWPLNRNLVPRLGLRKSLPGTSEERRVGT